MTEVLLFLAGGAIGTVVGWIACNWHWHARLAESWTRLRAAVWRRQARSKPVSPDRAVDVSDVTRAFSFGLVAEDAADADADAGKASGSGRA